MSTTTYQPATDTCAYRDCDREFAVGDAVDGSYCSKHCSWRDTGNGLLRDLRENHVICGSCFRLRKDIERPPETYLRRHFTRDGHGYTRDEETGEWTLQYYDQSVSRSAVVGFEDHRHARMGPEGLECRCGAVDHDAESQPLRNTAAWEWWLQLASEHLREIGARDDALTAADVAEAYHQKGDLGLAVGVALEARSNREAIEQQRDRVSL